MFIIMFIDRAKEKRETKEKAEPIYCFSHSRASRIQKMFLVGQPWWPTVPFNVQ